MRTRQKVDAQAVHIPLPFVAQYGLSPGTEVIVEFGPDGIFLSPAVTEWQLPTKEFLQFGRNLAMKEW